MLRCKISKLLNIGWILRELHSSKILCEAVIIDGKAIADQIIQEAKIEVDDWINDGGNRPRLIAILVGNNPGSKVYVKKKIEAAKYVGIDSDVIQFTSDISQKELLESIQKLNVNPSVNGILVQLPIPKHLNETEICQAVIPYKDVDGFHSENIGRLALNIKGIIPATALGVKELIIRSKIPTNGRNAVVIGRSKHVGFPIALLLHSDENGEISGLNITTTICHRYTPHNELKKYTKLADIVIAAAGVPGLITKEMIKPGACVIDVGISKVQVENKFRLLGDVHYESVKKVAGHITPVPGGVGPMTVAMLMKNTILATRMKENNKL
ncbi:PREDICTED: bifunctional methylenetetrahydrofolate dehydrogenase/cyclohydrolase, mitochondrial [Ceratosolen solmsi marchali]|uniref:methenyltetrahydrofolate cyclohydrolase n=1 Tax=Ceratosolen solmsi marchali TaxID=326594 RepID=A0AAJ7E0B2_9HYME|nr:PREDICTED: bifunctional methylenetetrahydrofolate dehydrogenase/cyclohydrolase, mitochondrial [Ceratosolen solmsi marchali]